MILHLSEVEEATGDRWQPKAGPVQFTSESKADFQRWTTKWPLCKKKLSSSFRAN
jgi:hypothetical protein